MKRSTKAIGIIVLVLFAVIVTGRPLQAYSYTIRFCRYGPSTGLTTTFQLRSPFRSGTADIFPDVNSKWNQPRDVESGSNPHQGIDLHADSGTDLYAIWRGWVWYVNKVSTYEIVLYLDLDGDMRQDDGAWVKYDHISDANVVQDQYVYPTTLIGKSGDEGGLYPAHLHYGVMRAYSSTTREGQWAPMERYYPQAWNSGKDLDFICALRQSVNTVYATAYALDETGTEYLPPGSVQIYHRPSGTTSWTADTMSLVTGSQTQWRFDLGSTYTTGQSVQYMIIAERPLGIDYVWGIFPAKYEQPAVPPNTSYSYDYMPITIQ